MATESQIRTVLNHLAEVQFCHVCGTRFRFGDLDCPHCGEDLEEVLRQWADRLVDALDDEQSVE
jgi:rubrerythrin